MPPYDSPTVFLLFDRPGRCKVGTFYPFDVLQLDARSDRPLGGMSARIEIVPKEKVKV